MEKKIRSIMSSEVATCRPTDDLRTVTRRMWSRDVGSLPVLDSGKAVGVITDRDIAMAAGMTGKPLAMLAVGSCMSSSLWSCSPEDSVADAEREMRAKQVHRLAVLDKGRLVGMVSLNDIARSVLPAPTAADARRVVESLGLISRPREALPASA